MIDQKTIKALYTNLGTNVQIIQSVNCPPCFPSDNRKETDWAQSGTVYNLPQEQKVELDRHVVKDDKGECVVISVCHLFLDKEYVIYCIEQ